jgi:hypothetical protein
MMEKSDAPACAAPPRTDNVPDAPELESLDITFRFPLASDAAVDTFTAPETEEGLAPLMTRILPPLSSAPDPL